MTKAQAATADVFLTALKALPKGERDAVVVRIARDRAFRRDILDLALIAERRSEPSRPFCKYLAERRGRWSSAAGLAQRALHRSTNKGAKRLWTRQ